jgi:hypothetical protein
MGTERGVESFFVLAGTAEADVGAATILGAAAGWATAADDEAARVRISVASAGSRAAAGGSAKDAATVRALAGNVWVRFHAVATWLPPGCEARLVPSADGPGSVSCSAAPSNPQPIDMTRATGGLTHAATLPAGSAVTLADRAGGTWFECRATDQRHPVRIEVRRDAVVMRSATIGRGAATRVSGADLVVEIPGLADGLLLSLTRLDREFATLGGE